jgi:CRP-like cAMP-binding protein
MAKKYSSVRLKTTSPPSNRDGDGNHVHNEILLGLPPKESDMLLPKLEFVRLKLHQVLHEAGETLKSGYFCNTGMFSVLTVAPDGRHVEVGLIGKEGFAGGPLIAGFRTSHTRAVVQAEGTAFRVDASVFRRPFDNVPGWSGSCIAFRSLWLCRLNRSQLAIGSMGLKKDWRDGCS